MEWAWRKGIKNKSWCQNRRFARCGTDGWETGSKQLTAKVIKIKSKSDKNFSILKSHIWHERRRRRERLNAASFKGRPMDPQD